MEIRVKTNRKRQVVDITDQVTEYAADHSGAVLVFVKHTTAAVTTADLDPGTDEDLLDALDSLIPEHEWRHPHDPAHVPDHLLASIIGTSVVVPVVDGRLQLGTYQRVILIELDGGRERKLHLTKLS